MLYPYSDPHFFHDRICRFTNRPFRSLTGPCGTGMHQTLIRRWNEAVPDDPGSVVVILGDLFFPGKDQPLPTRREILQILCSLNGRKILLKGNHDDWWLSLLEKQDLEEHFLRVEDTLLLRHNGVVLGLCHYPVPLAPHLCDVQLCGHIHNLTNPKNPDVAQFLDARMMFNCSCEILDYRPCPLPEVVRRNNDFYGTRYPKHMESRLQKVWHAFDDWTPEHLEV